MREEQVTLTLTRRELIGGVWREAGEEIELPRLEADEMVRRGVAERS